MKTSNDIRQSFLEFFKIKRTWSSTSRSLVPSNDPSLLFTNAGMVQFKDLFLGREKRNYVCSSNIITTMCACWWWALLRRRPPGWGYVVKRSMACRMQSSFSRMWSSAVRRIQYWIQQSTHSTTSCTTEDAILTVNNNCTFWKENRNCRF